MARKQHQRMKKGGRSPAQRQSHPMPREPPTRLNSLNLYLVSRVSVFLTDEDRSALTNVDHRFRRRTPPVKKDVGKESSAGTQSSKVSDSQAQESNDGSNKQPRKLPPSHASASGPSLADPDTLLARLNTRRLQKRLIHYKTNKLCKDGQPVYPSNKTTEEIAVEEWQTLLQNAREGKPDTIPSPYELLLFSPCPRAVTVLASYPRSGNSLMRNLFERATLRVTGSDMRGGLTKHDLVGEAAVSANMVQFVKTHFPERRGFPPFRASRVVLLTRNPYDAIESYFNLMMTNTHTTSISEEQRLQHEKLWEEMALKEIQVWKDFHEYWLSQNIPLLLVRYEDLIRFPDKVMARVVQFVLEISNMRFFNKRIHRCCIREEQIEQLGSYRPRSGGIGKSLSKYSPELLQQMNAIGILSTMEKLGYSEMLVANKDEWKLEVMDDFGMEFPGQDGQDVTPLVINSGEIVRGPQQMINWRAIKQAMNAVDTREPCHCYVCSNQR